MQCGREVLHRKSTVFLMMPRNEVKVKVTTLKQYYPVYIYICALPGSLLLYLVARVTKVYP